MPEREISVMRVNHNPVELCVSRCVWVWSLWCGWCMVV